MSLRRFLGSLSAAALMTIVPPALADGEVNLYTSRHYDSDQVLFAAFTEATGITVNVIEDKAGKLIERIKTEGVNSPADVFLTVDASNLMNAASDGLFQATSSDSLDSRIPANLRHPDGLWFAFTKRARVIMVREDAGVTGLERYEDLADPRFDDMICIRSSGNIYNQSLVGSLIAANGEEATAAWVQGLVANMAREPESNDTGQIRAVAAGECSIGVANTYYLARLTRSDDPADRAVAAAIDVILPNQDDRGTHVNISGAGVLSHAPNAANAVAFLEFLASDEAQLAFADGNNEWPAVEGVAHGSVLDDLYGEFAQDDISVATFGANRSSALNIMEANGWK
ncbi:MAG: Fe(3+) ABC transporter substrate-binding protein [Rhodospirillaceae bacterium]|nr:Fe(3+) ABC transporter substrate-binding protein [Rhodospirillaceae bacterium]